MHKWLTLIVLVVVIVPSAWPQASTGRLSGTVRDQSGGVIPNVSVTLTHPATAVTSQTRTNEAGFYIFPGLTPGSYRVSVEAPGMQRFESLFTVEVSQSVVIDPALKPGPTGTTVEVKGDVTPLVTVDNPTLRTGMERERIDQLPLNGRAFDMLLMLLPGNEGLRTFGYSEGSREYISDGAAQLDRQWADERYSFVGLDSIQEFTVESNAVSAKLSRPANVIVSTRSGTNRIHGSVFETHRNNAIGLARTRTDVYSKAPPLIRNEFGASAGGPLVLPKIYNGKDRTFWFFSYEALQFVNSITQGYTLPTTAMRNGDFSGLFDSQGRLQTLYDPWTTDPKTGARQPFSYGGKLNAIDPKRISPVAKYLFSITPPPSNNVNPLIDNNWWGPSMGGGKRWMTTTRVDHRFSPHDSFYAVLKLGNGREWCGNLGNCQTYYGDPGPGGMQYLNRVAGWQYYAYPQKSLATSWVHIFSPTVFNELLVSGRRQVFRGGDGDGSGIGADVNWADTLGLPNPFHTKNWPQFSSTGLSSYRMTTNNTKLNAFNYIIVEDNFTKIRGKHELQAGIHMRANILNVFSSAYSGTTALNWGSMATSLLDPKSTLDNPQAVPQTGNNLANMFLGVSVLTNTFNRSMSYWREKDYGLYLQDNFKATSRLTLNMGLRWEYWPPFREKNYNMVGFDRANHAIVTASDLNTMMALGATLPSLVATYQSQGIKFETAEQAGLPRTLVETAKRNFGPRLGVAYRALGGRSSFVVRGGYSVSYFNLPVSHWFGTNNTSTPLQGTYNYNPNDATQSPDGYSNWLLRNVPVYVDGMNTQNAVNLAQPRGITIGSAVVNYLSPTIRVPRVNSWNLTLEKEVVPGTLARVRYLGSHQSGLRQLYNYNATTPTYIWYASTGLPQPTGTYANVATRFYDQQAYGNIVEYRQSGWSNYEGMHLELNRRYKKGYGFQVFWVMSNSLITANNVAEVNQFMPGAVPADYHARDVFLYYMRDNGIPKHRVQWNWLVDLPFGNGKPLGRNASGLLQKLIGGWQFAGLGTLRSTYFTLPTTNWNFTGEKVQIYGYKYPIQDCRGGTCIPGYLWWNGYISPNQINSRDAKGNPNGYEGIPANYKPAVTPLIPWGSTAMPPNAPAGTNISTYWDTNNVWIPLKNGTVQRTTYGPGLHPWQNQYMPSVRQWRMDASLFKTVAIHEEVKLRFNADFFNVLNAPGNPNTIGADGFLNCRSSAQIPRVLQLSLRLSW